MIHSCEHTTFDEIKPIFVLLLLNSQYSANSRNPRLQETVQKFITQEKSSIPNYLQQNNSGSKLEPNHHILDLLRAQIASLGDALALANSQKRHDRNALEKETQALKSLIVDYKKTLLLNIDMSMLS